MRALCPCMLCTRASPCSSPQHPRLSLLLLPRPVAVRRQLFPEAAPLPWASRGPAGLCGCPGLRGEQSWVRATDLERPSWSRSLLIECVTSSWAFLLISCSGVQPSQESVLRAPRIPWASQTLARPQGALPASGVCEPSSWWLKRAPPESWAPLPSPHPHRAARAERTPSALGVPSG